MGTETILLLMALGAAFVAVVATALEVSPWWVFGLASGAGAVVLVVAAQELSQPCWGPTSDGTSGRLFGLLTMVSLGLYGAAALRAVVAGAQLSKAGEPDAAATRYFACPLASIVAGGVVFFVVASAALHCIN